MAKYRILLAQFPYLSQTHCDVADWVAETLLKCRLDPRIGEGNVSLWRISDTPITMGRNKCLVIAEKENFDYVVMIDNDLSPDLRLPGAEPFWDSSFEFAINHPGPCVIAAPYGGPPPQENCYAFKWTTQQGENPNPDFQIAAYTREEAARMTGIQRAAALPTGLMLIDMKAVKRLPHPRFYYEWTDETASQKASTEDVVFSRDLTYAGVPIYCNWQAYAGHWKAKRVLKPQEIPLDVVPAWIRNRARELNELQAQDQPIALPGRSHFIAGRQEVPAHFAAGVLPSNGHAVQGQPPKPRIVIQEAAAH